MASVVDGRTQVWPASKIYHLALPRANHFLAAFYDRQVKDSAFDGSVSAGRIFVIL